MSDSESPDRIYVYLEKVALWRDGASVVVSMKIEDRWIRVMKADCVGLFHVEAGPQDLRDKLREVTRAKRRSRHRV